MTTITRPCGPDILARIDATLAQFARPSVLDTVEAFDDRDQVPFPSTSTPDVCENVL